MKLHELVESTNIDESTRVDIINHFRVTHCNDCVPLDRSDMLNEIFNMPTAKFNALIKTLSNHVRSFGFEKDVVPYIYYASTTITFADTLFHCLFNHAPNTQHTLIFPASREQVEDAWENMNEDFHSLYNSASEITSTSWEAMKSNWAVFNLAVSKVSSPVYAILHDSEYQAVYCFQAPRNSP